MTDWGAHHFDIAQWGLGMDESGPVEIIPPEDPKADSGLRYVYANGVEVVHGGPERRAPSSAPTARSTSTAASSRACPTTILKEPLGEKDVHLHKSPGHQRELARLHPDAASGRSPTSRSAPARSTVCHLGNLGLLEPPQAPLGPARRGGSSATTRPTRWLDRERRDPWQLPAI